MLATTLAVVGVLAVLDFALRVYVGRGAGERPYDPPKVVAVPAAYDGKVAAARLESWFPKPIVQEEVRERVLALRGIFRAGGGVRATLYVEPSGSLPGRYVLVGRGDELEGWRVEAIESRTVKVSKGDQVRELEIFQNKQGSKAP